MRIPRALPPNSLRVWGNAWKSRLFSFFNVHSFLRDRETEHEQGRGREREGDTESEVGSRLRAISTEPDAGLELMDCEIMT